MDGNILIGDFGLSMRPEEGGREREEGGRDGDNVCCDGEIPLWLSFEMSLRGCHSRVYNDVRLEAGLNHSPSVIPFCKSRLRRSR